MTWRRKAFAVAVVSIAVTLGSAMASPAADMTYAIAGVETGFTDTSSSFVGVASGGNGTFAPWDAVIDRTPFDADRNATITGGSFRLGGVQGVITGGTIQNITTRCRKETFAIVGTIADLIDENGYFTGGTGTFDATLTHYRARIFGQCVTYSATVEGTVTFTSP